MGLAPEQLTRAREAFRLTSDVMMDLIAATQVHALFQQQFERRQTPEHVRTAVTRLCLFQTILSLAKWTEIYRRYKSVIPASAKEVAKGLVAELDRRGVATVRNTVVGHVWDKKKNRALTNEEIDERIEALTGSTVAAFLEWVNDRKGPQNLDTASGAIEEVRDRIREAYRFTDADLHR